MSNTVFPTLPGLAWSTGKHPIFKTKIQESVSGRELRSSFQAYPLWRFTLSYEFLRGDSNDDLKKLLAFFLVVRGSWDSFLYSDPDFSSVTDYQFGVGDGSTTQFQLTRAISAGGNAFVEPVQNVNILTNIKKAGVTQTSPANYSISSTGLVTFVSAPAASASLTWTGTYYYRCRFMMDEGGFDQFMKQLWELKKCEFKGAPGNKV
ncbi:DUF2460 domain-containing protein [Nitrosospira briensis]|uniref:DUF2460 domain-containing protein n=1 Tax=Nitrosospira briensis TaxID=35799 RepID=UPI00046963A2|nr:DUF2460 domain-containing protein [Nitrosospira briensis]